MLTKIEAVQELSTREGIFLSPSSVRRIGEPFGFYQTRKQLYVPEGGDSPVEVEGMESSELALHLYMAEGLNDARLLASSSKNIIGWACAMLIRKLEDDLETARLIMACPELLRSEGRARC